jgi:site-specific DNA recombinase
MEKKCLIYVRVSTEEQKLTGLSPEVQLKQAKEEVVKQNLKLAEPPYADIGKSGTTTNREGLQALLARCKQGDISYVIVQDTSRLSRDTTDYLLIKKIFKDYGIQIISINQPMANDDNS